VRTGKKDLPSERAGVPRHSVRNSASDTRTQTSSLRGTQPFGNALVRCENGGSIYGSIGPRRPTTHKGRGCGNPRIAEAMANTGRFAGGDSHVPSAKGAPWLAACAILSVGLGGPSAGSSARPNTPPSAAGRRVCDAQVEPSAPGKDRQASKVVLRQRSSRSGTTPSIRRLPKRWMKPVTKNHLQLRTQRTSYKTVNETAYKQVQEKPSTSLCVRDG